MPSCCTPDAHGLLPADDDTTRGHITNCAVVLPGADQGDVAESQATQAVLGSRAAISSLKSYMGHTLGACGALEAWMTLEMMKAGWFAPTLNLRQLDPRCGELDYLLGGGRKLDTEFAMSNNFAFGGINTSLIIRRL